MVQFFSFHFFGPIFWLTDGEWLDCTATYQVRWTFSHSFAQLTYTHTDRYLWICFFSLDFLNLNFVKYNFIIFWVFEGCKKPKKIRIIFLGFLHFELIIIKKQLLIGIKYITIYKSKNCRAPKKQRQPWFIGGPINQTETSSHGACCVPRSIEVAGDLNWDELSWTRSVSDEVRMVVDRWQVRWCELSTFQSAKPSSVDCCVSTQLRIAMQINEPSCRKGSSGTVRLMPTSLSGGFAAGETRLVGTGLANV